MPRNTARTVAAALLAAAALTSNATASDGVPSFYRPPSPLPGKRHGELIRSRALTTAARLPAAARNVLVLYRSTSLAGKPIAVSGTVAIPKGTPPRGGWPVISWAHGTSGNADRCAPSLDAPRNHATGDIPYTNRLLNRWVAAGYVVVRTDYEGLGTPGQHPWQVGDSEARGVIDIVRAARRLDPAIGRRWVAAGHSQGGQAALFAAADGPRWAPELRLGGVVAFAPPSELRALMGGLAAVQDPSPLSAFGGLFVVGVQSAAPELHATDALSPEAKALYPALDRQCLDRLYAPDSWGGLPPARIFAGDSLPEPLLAFVDRHEETATLDIRVPIRIEKGSADEILPLPLTDQLVASYRARGAHVGYRVYPGKNHHGVLAAGWADASAFIRRVEPRR